MESHHQRLVLGPDRADRDGQTVRGRPRGDVLGGIGADGGAGQPVRIDLRPVQDHPGVQRDQPLGRGEQRVDVDLLDPRLLDHQPTEPDQQPLQRAQIDGRVTAADPLQELEDPGALHHPPRQRRVQRRQGQRAVPDQFDLLPARAEQEHRAELRIGAATDDELVAVELDHRLDGHAQEVLGADALAYGLLDRAIAAAHRLGIGQVELHPADVGLVRDRLGVELQDRGVAEFRREGHGLFLRGGDPGRHDGDAVQLEQPLRFGLGQEGPPRGQDGGDQVLGPGAIGAAVLAAGQHRRLVQAAEVLAVAPHVLKARAAVSG